MPLLVVVLIIFLTIVVTGFRVVKQAHAYVIERLGRFYTVWGAGVHIKIPFLDRVVRDVSLKEQVADFPPQPVITKDNVTMQIDTVVYFQIMDPKLYTYGIEQPMIAIENLSATTLRNIIGDMELDECLTGRDTINVQMRSVLDDATDPWGIKINRVELKNILPPSDIQSAMEKQMKAERERRESILKAEGDKKSAVLVAEGEKESAVLRAEAQKYQLVKEAEGHAESIRLHKEAEAAGIIALREAEAEGIRKLREAGLSNEDIVKLKAMEAFAAAADGQSTKIIIPSEIQGIAGLASGVVESSTPASKFASEYISDPNCGSGFPTHTPPKKSH